MNEESNNQEREGIERKFKGMFATIRAFKERGASALDTSPRQSRVSKWTDRICLIGGLLMAGWLVFIIAYGLWDYIIEIVAALLVILFYWIIYRIGDRFGWWKKSNPY